VSGVELEAGIHVFILKILDISHKGWMYQLPENLAIIEQQIGIE